MSYRTDYTLMPESGVFTSEIQDALTALNVFEQISEYEAGVRDTMWHSWREDMIALSTQFPDVLFHLQGDGDERGDIWDCYFKDGMYQLEKAVIGEYDPSKMI